MSAKRGRPISTDTEDLALLQRRQRTAERTRRYYERRREAAAQQQTVQQSTQADTLIEQLFVELEVTQTLTGLGLRIQNVVLAQDARDAQYQQDAIPVDDHDTLYDEDDTVAEEQPISHSRASLQSSSSTITRFFPCLPSQSPFIPPTQPSPAIADTTISHNEYGGNIRNSEEPVQDYIEEESGQALIFHR
jgi:hypothetical protein